MKRSPQQRSFSQQVMTTLRNRFRLPVNLLMLFCTFSWSVQSQALVLIKTNSGPNTFLALPTLAPATNNAQNVTPGAADSFLFNSFITGSTLPSNFRIANTNSTLALNGLTITNPSVALLLQNGDSFTNTLTLGAGGIDMSQSLQNLTFSNASAGGTLTLATSAAQTWTVANSRTLTVSTALTLANPLELRFVGGGTGGVAGTIALGGVISGAGDLNITGMQGGTGGLVSLSASNTAWTGAVTVGGGAQLNLDQSAASQNKLADGKVLTLNRGTVNFTGTGGGTEVVAGVALGQGLNQVKRDTGTGILQMGAITRSPGAALNIGTASIATTNTFNSSASSGIMGGWAVVGFTDWAVSATSGTNISITALPLASYTKQANPNTWTTATQNILVDSTTTGVNTTTARTIGSLKFGLTTAFTLDMGTTGLTINDGANGGGILRNQNFATTIQGGFLTAGGNDAVADTLYVWNALSTMTIKSLIQNNGAGALSVFFSGGLTGGALQLEGANTYTGTTVINDGTVTLGGNSAASDVATLGTGAVVNHGNLIINKQASSNTTLANNISGTGNLTINRGTLTLSGNNSYAGDTTVSASTTLKLGSAASLPSDSRVVLNATSAVLDVNGFNATVAALQGAQATASVALGTTTLTLSGSDVAHSGTVNLLLSQAPQAYQGIISGAGANLVKNGNYVQQFTGTGALSYTGSTTVNAGTLQVSKPMATTSLILNGGTFIADIGASLPSVTSVNIGANASLIANSTDLIVDSAAVTLSGSGALWQLANGAGDTVSSLTGVANSRLSLGSGAASSTFTVNDNGGSPSTFSGAITMSSGASTGLANVVKNGSNTWILGGGNSYNGATTITGGKIQVAAAAAVQVLPDRTALTLANTAGVALDLNGHDETIGSLAGGGAAGGNVTLGAGTLTVGGNNTSTTYAGVLSGTGGLVKVGTGSLNLTGVNLVSGQISILGGTLALGNAAGTTLPSNAAVILSGAGATLAVNQSQTLGSLTTSKNSIITLGSGATLTTTYAAGGTVSRSASSSSLTRVVRITAATGTSGLVPGMPVSGTGVQPGTYIEAILNQTQVLLSRMPTSSSVSDFVFTNVNVMSAAISGSGDFTKNGNGTMILAGANTSSGTFNLMNGILQLGVSVGGKNIYQDVLSNTGTLNFGATGSPTLNFVSTGNVTTAQNTPSISAINVFPFERIGAISGGAVVGGTTTATINLNTNLVIDPNGLASLASSGVLAVGANNSNTTFTGSIKGGDSANGTASVAIGIAATLNSRTAWLIKEGTGTFTWNNNDIDTINGVVRVESGNLVIAGTAGLDIDSYISVSNRPGATLTVATTEANGDRVDFISGGGNGTYRLFSNNVPGALTGNYLNGTGGNIVLTSNLNLGNQTLNAMSLASPIFSTAFPVIYTYGGILSGPGSLIKEGNNTLELRGVSTYTGDTTIQSQADNTTSAIRLGAYSDAAGVGTMTSTAGGFGGLPSTTNLRLNALSGLSTRNVAFDISGASQTLNSLTTGFNNGSKTVSFNRGALTINTLTGTDSGIFDGTFSGRGTINVSATKGGSGWVLSGDSNTAQTGDFNITGGLVTLSGTKSVGTLGDFVNVKIGALGTLNVFTAESVGSLSGTGNLILTKDLRLNAGVPGFGTSTNWAGTTSGPGGIALNSGASLRITSNQGYTGDTTLSNGSILWLDFTQGATNILPNAGKLILNGGTITLNGGTSLANTIVEAVGGTTVGLGSSVIAVQSGSFARINLGAVTRDPNGGGVLQIKGTSASSALTSATVSNPWGMIGGWATYGSGFYVTDWAVPGVNSNSPIGALSSGGFNYNTQWASNRNVDVKTSLKEVAGDAISVRFNTLGPAILKLGLPTQDNPDGGGPSSLLSGGILVTRNVGPNNILITGQGSGTEVLTGAQYGAIDQIIIHQHNPLGTLTINVPISEYATVINLDDGTRSKGQLIKAGQGRVILTKDNSYNGQTSILAGVLQLGDPNDPGTGGDTGNVGSGSAPILNQGYLSIQRSSELLLVNDIVGSGTLRMEGSGSVELSGSGSSYTGATSVLKGTLRIANSINGLGSVAGLTTIAAGATLSLSGVVIPETFVIQGGILTTDVAAGTTTGSIMLTANSSFITKPNAPLTTSGPIIALPNMSEAEYISTLTIKGSDITNGPNITILSNINNSLGHIEIEPKGTLQVGNNTASSLGRGSILNNGQIIVNDIDGHFVIGNAISGTGGFKQIRNTVYLTGHNTYSGITQIGDLAVPAGVEFRLGTDTYDTSIGTGDVILQSNTGGSANMRTHLIGDTVFTNNFFINPYTNGATSPTALNSTFLRQGIGNVEFAGTIVAGPHNVGPAGAPTGLPNTQRAVIQSEGGGKLIFSGTITNGTNSRLNIINNGVVEFSGSTSNDLWGVLSGGGVYTFNTTGTTTLKGVNTFTSGNTIIQRGKLVIDDPAGTALEDNNDQYVLRTATLQFNYNETIGALYTEAGSTVMLGDPLNPTPVTLVIDDNVNHGIFGKITDTNALTGNGVKGTVNFNATGGAAWYGLLGLSDFTGDPIIGSSTQVVTVRVSQLANAGLPSSLGAGSGITLGLPGSTQEARLEYFGAGNQSTNKTINLSNAAATDRIAANGNGTLSLNGDIKIVTSTGNKTLVLHGQSTAGNFVNGILDQGNNVLTLQINPIVANDDRYGASKWIFTNANNNFSGNLSINMGILELRGDLKTGSGNATTVFGNLTGARTIDMGVANWDGRRYDITGGGDQLGGLGGLTNIGTLIFSDPNAGTATFASNITFNQSFEGSTNPGGGEFINNGTKTIVINGNLQVTGSNGARNWMLDGTNTTTNTINGVISNGGGSAVISILKEGPGTWRIAGNNTFTGGINVSRGTLEIANGNAINDAALVNLTNLGSDGSVLGPIGSTALATIRFVNSETIGGLTGGVGSSVIIDSGATLTLLNANQVFNGVISGAGGLTRSNNDGNARIETLTNLNTYTGVTRIGTNGTNLVQNRIDVNFLANGGQPSGIGKSTSDASNLVIDTGTAGGGLRWTGFTNQSTDRLFTVASGTGAAALWADGVVTGNNVPTIQFTNTGALVFTGGGATTLTLRGSNKGDNVFNPSIGNNGASAVSLTKTDPGTWVIGGNSSFTGAVTVSQGTLAVTNNNALGTSAGGVIIQLAANDSVAYLDLRGVTITGEPMTLNAGANNAFAGVAASTGNSVWTGTVTNNITTNGAYFSIANGASLKLSGVVSGGGIFNKWGSGTLTLSGANTMTGAFNARGGTLVLDYSAADNSKLGDAAVLTLGSGTGISYLRGNGASYRGQEPLLAGAGTSIVLNGGTHTEIVGSTTLDAGANYISRNSGSTAKLNLKAITRAVNTGSTLDIADPTAVLTTSVNMGTSIFGGFATIGKTDWAVGAATAGTDTNFTKLASYTTSSSGTTTEWAAANNVTVVGTPAFVAGWTINSLRFNDASDKTLTLSGANIINTGGLLVTPNVGSANILITGGTLTSIATATAPVIAPNEIIVHQYSSGILTIASQIVNNGSTVVGLTKSGLGTLVLAADNTYTGTSYINEGVVRVGAGGNFGQLGSGGGQIVLNGNLIFNSTQATTFTQSGTLRGSGNFILDSTNTRTILLTADNTTFVGNFIVNGGTLAISSNGNALGNTRMQATINSGGTIDIRNISTPGTNFAINGSGRLMVSTGSSSLSGALIIADGQSSSLEVGTGATMTLGNLIHTATGMTKTGNGLLVLNANQMQDIIPGAIAGSTTANANPALMGQFLIKAGEVRLGNPRALGGTGVGNETIVYAGATLDLRNQQLSYGDDSDPYREIISIAGTGLNGMGALRNTANGTATFSGLQLTGNATIGVGGVINGNSSRLELASYDTNVNSGSSLNGTFDRQQPVIYGGGFDLTIIGSINSGLGLPGMGGIGLHEPKFVTALHQIIIREGHLRIEEDAGPLTAWTGISSSDVTAGIEIGYGGPTLADVFTPASGLGYNVGARLNFYRNADMHHTVSIIMNGVLALANNGYNYIDMGTDTVTQIRTFLDGSMTLIGPADRNIIHTEVNYTATPLGVTSTAVFSAVDQGNMTATLEPKLIIGGVISGNGGFTKTGFRELRLTANNTFTGDLNIFRFGSAAVPWQNNLVSINGVDYQNLGDAEGWAEWGVTLSGANGALSGVSNINLQRRGMLNLDNTKRLDASSGIDTLTNLPVVGGNNNDRINDAANINFRDGWLRITGGTSDNSESLATTNGAKVNLLSGTNILDLWPTDGAGTNMTLTIGQINRQPGSLLRITDLDSTSTFSTAAGPESVRIRLNNATGLTQVGAAAGMTDKKIVIGLIGGIIPHTYLDDMRTVGFNNGNVTDLLNQGRNQMYITGSHFMTIDNGYLRPLDDSEYFTPASGVMDTISGAAGQNINLMDSYTVVRENMSINALHFGPLSDSDGSGGAINGNTTLTSYNSIAATQLMVDGTLTISSGMLSSAWFTVGGSGPQVTTILGGNINFGSREAIINNQNANINLTAGAVSTQNLEIRSNIMGTGGLLKTGLAQVVLDGRNTYSGTTTISEGTLFIRSGRNGLGNSRLVVIEGSGNLNTGGGIQIGTPSAPIDILYRPTLGDVYMLRVNDDLTNWYANAIIDNVDPSGQSLGTPRMRTDGNATAIINGNIYGGPTAISNDILAIDARIMQIETAGNNVFLFRGQFGDRADANGKPIPVPDLVSGLPTLAGVRTNENEVLRVQLVGGTDDTVFNFDSRADGASTQYNAAGRVNLYRGTMWIGYDPAAPGNDGNGFWTNTAISRIPNRDSNTGSFAINGGTSQIGFSFQGNGAIGLFLTRPNQVFNMASWNANTGVVKVVGGANETGTVTYGDGTGSLFLGGLPVRLFAAPGGTVVFNQRMTGNSSTSPNNVNPNIFGFSKIGKGTVILQNTGLNSVSDANFEMAGGTLILDHTGLNLARVGAGTAIMAGGTLQIQPNQFAQTVANIATNGALDNDLQFRLGSTEIIAEARNGQNMIVMLGNSNPNTNSTVNLANLLRSSGATTNLVEWVNGGNTAQIQLSFNAATTAASKGRAITWATYGTAPRTATDFAMADAGQITFTGNTATNTTISGIASTTGMYVGMSIVGPGIPVGATITAVTVNSLTISLAATSSVTGATLTAVVSDVRAFGRAPEEYVNNAAAWGAGMDVSENSGGGFYGTLASSLSINSLRFDTPADSVVTIPAGQTLTVAGDGIAGAILVSSNVGAANKTITGGSLATSGSNDLIFHQYGSGVLTVASALTGSGAMVVTGPDSTNPANLNSTGTVKFTGNNTYTGPTIISGAVLEVASLAALGTAPVSVGTTGSLTLNGGTFRYTGPTASLGNRDVRFEGVGGVIEVTNPDTNLLIGSDVIGVQAQIASQDIYRGDLVKTGPGMLTLQGNNVIAPGNTTLQNAGFMGLIDVRQGSLNIMVDVGDAAVGTTQILGTNRTWLDGTIMRAGTNFGAFLGNGNLSGDWNIEEYFTFEGNNTFTYGGLLDINANNGAAGALDGQLNLGSRRPLNLNGLMLMQNDPVTGLGTTFDVNLNGVLRLNNGSGYMSGSGDIIKDGNGQLEFRANEPEWKGGLVIKQGTVYAINQADMLGVGYLTGKKITLGDSERGGIAQLLIQNPDGVQNHQFEVNHDIEVVYNPAQTKRLGIDNVSNGDLIAYNGNVTLNDNLIIFLQDGGISNGGEQAFVNFNGSFKDGAVTSGNMTIFATENGGANDNTSGRNYGYASFNGNNSAWTGDISISGNLTYDQDKTAILRLGHSKALTAANDVVMNFNSILQAGGQTVTIGSLTTMGGVGNFNGDAGTIGSSGSGNLNGGSSEIIENAAATPGFLTIAQATPTTFEALWDAKFRDGTINSQFFAPGANVLQPSASLSIIKDGPGWATLTLDNDYTGTTTVKAGVLQVGKNGVGDTGAPTASGTFVLDGGTLAGSGIIQGGLTLSNVIEATGPQIPGGIVSPGDLAGAAMGTLIVNGAMLFGQGASALMQVKTPTYNNPGVLDILDPLYSTWKSGVPTDTFSNALHELVTPYQHDQVNVMGTLNWTVGSKVTLLNEGYTPKAGDIFQVFAAQSIVGGINVGPALRVGNETNASLDLILFPLGGDYLWDTSLFNSQGILMVVQGVTPSVTAPVVSNPTVTPTSTAGAPLEPGTHVVLSVTATSANPGDVLTYSWRRRLTANDQPVAVAGATGATYEFDADTFTKGVYDVVVSGVGGSTVSTGRVSVFVNDQPHIVAPFPVAQLTVNPGSNPSFTVTATGGALTYQWRKQSGATWVNVDGATSDTLSFTNVTEAEEGVYDVVVSNTGGSIASSSLSPARTSKLIVNDPVTNVVASRTPADANLYEGDKVTFSVTAQGGPFTYQWQKNGVDLLGQKGATLVINSLPVSSDDFTVKVGNAYYSGSPNPDPVTSNVVHLNVLRGRPAVTSNPSSKILHVGDVLDLQVAATGKDPLKFQWKRNNGAVAGATLPRYLVTSAAVANGGTYTVDVSNTIGKADPGALPVEVVVVDNTPKVLAVPENTGTATITVNVGAGPATGLSYEWFKNDVSIPNPDPTGRVTGMGTKTLKITKATAADTAIYTCVVKAAILPGSPIVGGTTDLRVFNSAPDILPSFNLPAGIIGGTYSYKVPVSSDPDAPSPNPAATPLTYSATGLPPGLKIDAATGIIGGKPTATKPAGYNVTVTATNAKGKDTASGILMVNTLPTNIAGVYTGPVDRQVNLNGNLGGRIDLTVTSTATFTGKLIMGTVTYSLTGALDIDVEGVEPPKATLVIKRTGTPLPQPLVVTFAIDTTKSVITDGKITDGFDNITFAGWRQIWNTTTAQAVNYLGLYNFGLDIPSLLAGHDDIPQGNGYGTFTVAKDGKLSVSGKTADGESFTTATFVGPTGQVLVYQTLYTTTPKGSLGGYMIINDKNNADPKDNQIVAPPIEYLPVDPPEDPPVDAPTPADGDTGGGDTGGGDTGGGDTGGGDTGGGDTGGGDTGGGTAPIALPSYQLTWLRPASTVATARTYKAGFGPVVLTPAGGFYAPPVAGTVASPSGSVVLQIPENTTSNARITFSEGGVEKAAQTPTNMPDSTLTIAKGNKVTVAAPAGNPTKLTMTPTPATGAFKGGFTMSQPNPRTVAPTTPAVISRAVTYQGLIIQEADGSYRGYGYFLLPQLPNNSTLIANTPILSGQVVLQKTTNQ